MYPLPPQLALIYAHMVAEERQREASRARLANEARGHRSARERRHEHRQQVPGLRRVRARVLGLLTVVVVTGGTLLLMVVIATGGGPATPTT